jgi:transcriptional regulator with XRE-family HTH domain
MKDIKIVGEKIKTLRQEKSITQQALADQIGISPQAVSKWENGDSYPDLQQLISLSELFKISLDDLLKDDVIPDKSDYWVYETIENKSLIISFEQVNASQTGLQFILKIYNKTDSQIRLNSKSFMLLNENGTIIEPKRSNIINSDDDIVATRSMHKIPEFIPGMSSINVELLFVRSMDFVKLWINIENICMNKCFLIKPKLHTHEVFKTFSRLSDDELVYFYNFSFKLFNMKNIKYPGNNDFLKIPQRIINQLKIPLDETFILNKSRLFSDEALQNLLLENKFFDYNIAKRVVNEENQMRQLIKKNFEKIEKSLKERNASFLTLKEPESYMDKDIIEFVIKMTLIYAKEIKQWQYSYVTETFYKENSSLFTNLNFRNSLELFKTKVNRDTINVLLLQKDISDFSLYHIIKLKDYFGDDIFQSTLDELLLKFDIESKEDLMKIKPALSEKAWKKAKERFFNSEISKLEEMKNNL